MTTSTTVISGYLGQSDRFERAVADFQGLRRPERA
jgi:hypothetical protein